MPNFVPLSGWPQIKDLPDLQGRLNRIEKIEAWKADTSYIEETGAEIEIDNCLGVPANKLSLTFAPQQNLHGYDKPWAPGAGKNKLDFKAALDYWGAEYTDNGDGSYTITRVGSGYSTPYQFATSPSVVSLSAASIVSLTTGGNWKVEIYDETNETWKSISSAALTQIGVNANKIRLNYGNHGDGATISKIQIELGSSVTSYAPYSNICPITGITTATVQTTDGETTNTASMALGETVYAGSVNFNAGTGSKTNTSVTVTAFTNKSGNTNVDCYFVSVTACKANTMPLCNMATPANSGAVLYDATRTDIRCGFAEDTLSILRLSFPLSMGIDTIAKANAFIEDGLQVEYELATPTTLSLTPDTLTMLRGTNSLSTSDGSIYIKALTGRAF